MEHFSLEDHLGRHVGEVVWKVERSLVEPLLKRSTSGSFDAEPPLEHVAFNEAYRDVDV